MASSNKQKKKVQHILNVYPVNCWSQNILLNNFFGRLFNLRIIVDRNFSSLFVGFFLFIFPSHQHFLRQSCDCRLLNRLKPQNWFNLIIKTMSSLCSHGTQIRFYCSFPFSCIFFVPLVLLPSLYLSLALSLSAVLPPPVALARSLIRPSQCDTYVHCFAYFVPKFVWRNCGRGTRLDLQKRIRLNWTC